MGVHRARRICSTSTAPGRSGIFCALALLGACATPAPRVVSPTAPAKETTPSSRPAPVAPPCADAVKLPAWSPKLEPRLLPRPRRGRTTALLCPLDNPGDCDARCTRGSAVDCYLLGLARYHGKGGPADLPAALAGFQKACALGMERACMNQAVMLDRGQGTPKKPLQAAAIYGRLCLKNVDASCSTLNRLRKRAPRASPVFWRTYREIKRREKQGIPSARWLGSDLMYFSKREDQDAGTSPDWLTITGSELEWAMHDNVVWCSRGHVNHCHHLAHDLIQGKGLRPDGALAVALFRYACRKEAIPEGISYGCVALAGVYELGWEVPRDTARAAAIGAYQCDRGNLERCVEVGQMYRGGRGLRRSTCAVRHYYWRACAFAFFGAGARDCGFLRLYPLEEVMTPHVSVPDD